MRTSQQKQHEYEQSVPTKITKSKTPAPAAGHKAHPLLSVQSTIGNQAVMRSLQTTIQPKLTVNTPGDSYEREADEFAEQVMRMPEPQLQRSRGWSKCQTEQPSHNLQRLQSSHVGSGNTGQTTAPTIVHEVLSSPGQPLDPSTRAFMEPRFGRDFSQVRVHADAQAAESAQAVNAAAYTVGSDVVFGAGQYTPGTMTGRGLVAHELAHVIQQGYGHPNPDDVNGPFLQRKLVTESAGACGVCNEARYVGSEVHTLIQTLSFPPNVRREFPIGFDTDPANGDMDGRLDLLEIKLDPIRQTIEAYIGEIKPNNYRGIKAGMNDLAFYRRAVRDFFKQAFPDYAVTVEFLDIDPNPAVLPYLETQSCPGQAVEIENAHDGLYLYSCAPPRSQLRTTHKHCCGDKDEDDATQKAGDLAQIGSQLFNLQDDKKQATESKLKTETPEEPSSSPSTAERAAQLLARATTLGKIAEYHIRVYAAFASWAYTSVYEGTRGYNLKQKLSELAEQAQPLWLQAIAALTLASDLQMMEEVAESETETAGVRVELTKYELKLSNMIYQLGRTLESARSYSAIEKRIDLREGDQYALYLDRGYELRTGLGVSLAKPEENDATSLALVIEYEADVAKWLLTQVGNIFNDLEGLINDDQSAWLDSRP